MTNRLIITLLLFFLTAVCFSQVVKVKDGISVLGMTDSNAKSWAKSKGYIMEVSEVADLLNFRKISSLGDQVLEVAIKDHKVSVISWEEHAMYASKIMGEVKLAGFVLCDAKTTRVLPFKNRDKNLVLSLITKDETNQIMIVIGRNVEIQQANSKSRNSSLQYADFGVLNLIKSVDDFFQQYGEGNNIKALGKVEGENFQQYLLYPDTQNEVVVVVENNKIIQLDFLKKQSDWRLPLNIKLGMSMESIVNLNQKDFSIYGFEWDEGGTVVNWNKGRFAQLKIVVQFSAGENVDQKKYLKVIGEKVFNTGQEALQGLGITVKKISIIK